MTTKSNLSMIPIQKTDVYREVIERISKLIEDNGYKAGDRLPSERELSELLRVSRTTLRQGIKVMESMGRVETRVGSGTYICPDSLPQISYQDMEISKKGVADIISVRCGIETTALLCFFSNSYTQENISKLEKQIQEREESIKHDIKRSQYGYKYNFEFEELIAQMTGNKILILQQQQIHALWTYLWGKLGFLPRIGHGSSSHQNILDAIKSNEPELACIYMRKHIKRDLEKLFSTKDND